MKIEDVFYKLRPICGKRLDRLWQEYLVADPPLRRVIEKTLRVQLAQRLGETFESENLLLKPPPQELAQGQYPIGTVYYGDNKYYDFGLRETEFIQHIGIFGRSGCGKTNLAFMLLEGLAKADKPFLVFDWKRNYRDLLSKNEFEDLLVFTVGRDISSFRFNPLIPPPGTPAKVWLKKLIEIICHAYFLGEGVAILLLRAIDSLYQQFGLYTSKPKGYPTVADVRSWLGRYKSKGREAGWMESSVRAIETLCFGEVGNVLNSEPFFDIPKLLEKSVILELDALTNTDKTFLIESLLLWIHHYRMAQDSREQFKHAIIIEEAHHILLRKKQEATGEETVTDVLLREIRELGESVICLDQHPSLISKPALGNTYTTFAMNLKHRGDIAMIQDSLLLSSEQAGFLGRLEVGWAIVRLQGRWFWPFLVKLPEMDIQKGVITDARLKKVRKESRTDFCLPLSSNRNFSSTISTKEEQLSPKSSSKQTFETFSHSDKKHIKDRGEDENRCAIKLTTQQKNLLKQIWQKPNLRLTERYTSLGMDYRSGNKMMNSVLSSGLVCMVNLSFYKGGIKGLLLTERGEEVLGIETNKSNRAGGPVHKFWLRATAEHLKKQGFAVTEEAPVGNGKTIDVLAVKDGQKTAFEIETGKSDAAGNVEKCLNAKIERIVVVTTSITADNKIKNSLAGIPQVQIIRAAKVIKQKW